MHVHGNYNVPTPQASAYQQTQALAQKRAEETRRKLASSMFALTEHEDGARSGGQSDRERQGQSRRDSGGRRVRAPVLGAGVGGGVRG